MPIPVSTAELVGTFLEAIGFGFYMAIFPRCLRVTLRKNIATRLRIYFLVSMTLIGFFATLHMVVDLIRAFEAFAGNMDVVGSPETYYENVNTRLNQMKNSAYTSATIVADALLVYRTFVVWGRNYWLIILPTLILIVDFAMSVWFTWSINEARPGNSVLVSAAVARSKYFLIATLILNVLCTVLISSRIWWIQSKVGGFKSSKRGASALTIIVESAAIYSAVTVVLIVFSVLGQSPFFFFLNSMPPLIGVVFSYIIIRSSVDDDRFQESVVSGPGPTLSYGGSGRIQRPHTSVPTKPGNGVHISLQRIVHRDDIDVEQQSDKSFGNEHKLNQLAP